LATAKILAVPARYKADAVTGQANFGSSIAGNRQKWQRR
jgi:hypothetical protein